MPQKREREFLKSIEREGGRVLLTEQLRTRIEITVQAPNGEQRAFTQGISSQNDDADRQELAKVRRFVKENPPPHKGVVVKSIQAGTAHFPKPTITIDLEPAPPLPAGIIALLPEPIAAAMTKPITIEPVALTRPEQFRLWNWLANAKLDGMFTTSAVAVAASKSLDIEVHKDDIPAALEAVGRTLPAKPVLPRTTQGTIAYHLVTFMRAMGEEPDPELIAIARPPEAT